MYLGKFVSVNLSGVFSCVDHVSVSFLWVGFDSGFGLTLGSADRKATSYMTVLCCQ